MRALSLLICFLLTVCLLPLSSNAVETTELSDGQTVYVPAYSHIYIGNRANPFMLTVTLSIRNTDLKKPIKITRVEYYETQGKMVKKFLEAPVILKPLESLRYIIPERDKSGGSGANFIVDWEAESPLNPPIIESVMIGAGSTQGISFVSRGREIIKQDKK